MVLVKDLIALIQWSQRVRVKEGNTVIFDASFRDQIESQRPELLDREVMHLARFAADRNGGYCLTFTIYKKSDQS